MNWQLMATVVLGIACVTSRGEAEDTGNQEATETSTGDAARTVPPMVRGHFVEVKRYSAPEAKQAVAVDAEHIYAIGNSVIGKYSQASGERIKTWTADDTRPLVHLNSGIVRGSRLYCAHSNYPQYPEASSIEVWDTRELKHIDSISLGICGGSLTWIEPFEDGWYAVFAHYSDKAADNRYAKPNTWTELVKFDERWRRTRGWVFPKAVLDQFAPDSCSGGGFGPDSCLYCTGHDRGELYRLEFPKAGSTLRLSAVLPAPVTGQGIAWQSTRLFGIDRPKRQVVVSKWVNR